MKDTNYLIKNGVDLSGAIKLLGDINTYNETLPNYVSSLTKKMASLKDLLIKGDMTNYTINVHSIKSDAKFFGFKNLSDIAYSHELKSKDSDIIYLKLHFNELVDEANKTINIIYTYLSSEEKKEEINKNKPNILLADDSEVVIIIAKKILDNDYNIIPVYDGAMVINMLNKSTEYDAILLDLNMPKIDGYGVLEYMKEKDLFNKIPVSIISGNNDKESIEKAFKYPIIDMLNKPFNDKTIKSIVKKTINRKK